MTLPQFQFPFPFLFLFLFLVTSNSVNKSSADISCYGCSHPSINKSAKMCSNFQPSKEYEIRCQYSTFCMKKTSELDLLGGSKIRVIERGCAPQESQGLRYDYENNRWLPVTEVDETLYVEGCSWEQTNLKATETEYCYCSSNFCNSGQRVTRVSLFHRTDAMSVVFIFNVAKLMRGIR